MLTYVSTFITGFTDVVVQAMPKGTKILSAEDGLITYHTPADVRTILQLPFINNSYILINDIPHTQLPINTIVRQLMQKPDVLTRVLAQLPKRPTTFRLMASVNNQLTAIDPRTREQFEHVIARNKLFTVNRTRPDIEFVIMKRQNGHVYCTVRLTHHENYEKTLKKGELYPELSYLLCLLSEPKKEDVFLDPFCGSGSIPLTRLKYFPAAQVYATDTEKSATNYTLLKAKKLKRRLEIFNWNALDLSHLPNASVSKIVTDPPWRLSNEKHSIEVFYTDMLKEFSRVLRSRSICVLLIENQAAIETALIGHPEFKILKIITTLVSGRKASVYKLIRL